MSNFTIPYEELRHLYVEARMTTIEIARYYGCSPTTISFRMKRYGIAARAAHFQPAQITEEVLRRLYVEERLPIDVIAQQLGVSVGTIHNYRRALGIPRRPRRAG